MIGTAEYMGRMVTRGRASGSNPASPRCLLVGAGQRAPAFLAALFEEGFNPMAVETVDDAREVLAFREADLVVVAGEGGGADPFVMLRTLSLHVGQAKLLFLANRNDPHLAGRALDHGAHDVVTPPHSAAAIALRYHIAGLRTERRPAPITSAPRPRVGGMEFDVGGRRVLDEGRPINLSGREFELLTRLLAAGGEVVSREALLEDIWGSEQGSEAVLDATVHRLRRKLEADLADPRILTTVRGVGYRLEPAEVGVAAD